MKVVYNSCYGGFGLSPIALNEFAKKKGIILTWYEHQDNRTFKRADDLTNANSYDYFPSTEDIGEFIADIPDGYFYYVDFYETEFRVDLDLVNVVESLGEVANGTCAELSIIDIPDGANFEIEDYDGKESVLPPRQSW